MDTFAIARLGLGLLGVLAAVEGVSALPQAAAAATVLASQHGSVAAVFGVLLPFAMIWGLSYYLVFRNLTLAKYLSNGAAASGPVPSTSPLRVLVGLAGLVVFVYALPSLIMGVLAVLSMDVRGRDAARITSPYLAQAAIGAALMLWPDAPLRLWTRGASEETAT